MAIYYRYNANVIMVLGQTYPHKDAIKALGGRFVGDRKIWQLPNTEQILDEVAKLCQLSGGGALDQPAAADAPEHQVTPLVLNRPLRAAPASRQVPASPPDYLTLPEEPAGALASLPATGGDSLTVAQLMERAHIALHSAFPQPLWIVGEIQNCQARGRGMYFNLAEEDRQGSGQGTVTVNAVIWQQVFKTLERRHGQDKVRELMQDGLQVRCLCQVALYKGRGNISLTVCDIDITYTQGALALAREKLLRELRAQGLDTANKHRTLAALPFHIGLLTADGSRAHSDFLHQLSEGGFPGVVSFVSIAMQGEKVPGQVQRGLALLASRGCDVIILTRGGGSAADLRWFDVPEVAYAIAHCPVPVVAAIGHHDDFCVAEEICYHRRKTPTAAADFILECFHEVHNRLEKAAKILHHQLTAAARYSAEKQAQLFERLGRSVHEALRRRNETLLRHTHGLERAFREHLHCWEKDLARISTALPIAVTTKIQQRDNHLHRVLLRNLQLVADRRLLWHAERLEGMNRQLIASDPTPWLKQGWTCLYDGPRKVVALDQIAPGALLSARLLDGSLQLRVMSKDPAKSPDQTSAPNTTPSAN